MIKIHFRFNSEHILEGMSEGQPPKPVEEEESESDDADVVEDDSDDAPEEEETADASGLVAKLERNEEAGLGESQSELPATPNASTGSEAPRKRHKEDFDWDDDIIGRGAFGEVQLLTPFAPHQLTKEVPNRLR
jgi:hypothetical protein